MYFWTTSQKCIHYKPIRYAPIFSFRLELFSACRHNNSLSIKTLWRHNWERRLAVRGSGSPDSVHVDSHMRCLLFKKTLSNQYIFIRIEMLFISDFNVLILCKYEAYFALNLFCGVITLCKNAWHKSLTVPTGST